MDFSSLYKYILGRKLIVYIKVELHSYGVTYIFYIGIQKNYVFGIFFMPIVGDILKQGCDFFCTTNWIECREPLT